MASLLSDHGYSPSDRQSKVSGKNEKFIPERKSSTSRPRQNSAEVPACARAQHTSLPGATSSQRILFFGFTSGRCNEKTFSLLRLAEFEQLASLKLPKSAGIPSPSPPVYNRRMHSMTTQLGTFLLFYNHPAVPCCLSFKGCLTSAG